MMDRRTFLSFAPAVLVLQAAPPVDVLQVNRLQQAYTLLNAAVVDAANAGVVTQQLRSLIADWYARASLLLQAEGVTQQIDTVLADLLTPLNSTDRNYALPYVTLIVTLRQAGIGAA